MLASYARQRFNCRCAYTICAARFFPLRVFWSSQYDGRAVRGPRIALSITSLWAVSRRLILTCWQFAGSFSGYFLLRRAVERHEHGSGASISGFCGLAVKFAVRPLRRFVGLRRRLSSLAGSFYAFSSFSSCLIRFFTDNPGLRRRPSRYASRAFCLSSFRSYIWPSSL